MSFRSALLFYWENENIKKDPALTGPFGIYSRKINSNNYILC